MQQIDLLQPMIENTLASESQRQLSLQIRMSQLQVFNWGTFSGLHRITIAEQGFLFIGSSGSGKSTLLDAISAMLVPPIWLGFNAAAREGEKSRLDRNIALYVRGAHGEQTDDASGQVATQFLRKGTTWSAIALTFANQLGKKITLIGLFILKGSTTSASEVKRHYFISDREFDLAKEFVDFDLDIRKFKQHHQDLFHTEKFKPFSERFRLQLNIDTDMALKLLHKTQSAKNLGDLNEFLREYMLDEPETFAVADRMINEFTELDAAHKTVVMAREQVEILRPAQSNHQQLEAVKLNIHEVNELENGLAHYTEQLKVKLFKQKIQDLNTETTALQGHITKQQDQLAQARDYLRRLESQRREQGGDRIEQINANLLRNEQIKQQRQAKHHTLKESCNKLAWTMPNSPESFAKTLQQAREYNENWQEISRQHQLQRDTLRDNLRQLETQFIEVNREIKALERQPSNIPAFMLEIREKIVAELNLHDSDFPFVGELIEVAEAAKDWRGAIERVLHGFALSILVSDKHYAMFSKVVNEMNLRGRLVYYRVDDSSGPALDALILESSLINKLKYKPHRHHNWLLQELKQRFNYTCVENLTEFRKTDYAITQQGQIRHGRSRHEKDDRHTLDDKRFWALGFDNREKMQLYQKQAQQMADQISVIGQQLSSLESAHQKCFNHAMTCQNIVNITWRDIDIGTILDEMSALQSELQQLQDANQSLKQLSDQIQQQETVITQKEESYTQTKANHQQITLNINELQEKLVESEQLCLDMNLTLSQQEGLSKRFATVEKITVKNIISISHGIELKLKSEIGKFENEKINLQKEIEKSFQKFKDKWPQEAADLDASIEAIAEFMAKLSRLEHDGLPAYEQRFFDMLNAQSMENLASLNSYLSQARNDIIERLDLVNESLTSVPYHAGTYLKIEVFDRQLESVTVFRQQIKEILSYAWHSDKETAERRFNVLRELITQLSGQEYEQQRWRKIVLDVRLHVEFLAREYDVDGKEVQVHRSGSGKSGGQREKLTTTCLAAALSYQLGGRNNGFPLYAPVVLDEAFSKADNDFTQEVMQVFTRFGFQMIVATPFKSVMTLEPFIGGACVVDIKDRKTSSTLQIMYNHETKILNLEN